MASKTAIDLSCDSFCIDLKLRRGEENCYVPHLSSSYTYTCLHSSCFMSNDIQLLLLGCESTRCHMDVILRRLCIKENVHFSMSRKVSETISRLKNWFVRVVKTAHRAVAPKSFFPKYSHLDQIVGLEILPLFHPFLWGKIVATIFV